MGNACSGKSAYVSRSYPYLLINDRAHYVIGRVQIEDARRTTVVHHLSEGFAAQLKDQYPMTDVSMEYTLSFGRKGQAMLIHFGQDILVSASYSDAWLVFHPRGPSPELVRVIKDLIERKEKADQLVRVYGNTKKQLRGVPRRGPSLRQKEAHHFI